MSEKMMDVERARDEFENAMQILGYGRKDLATLRCGGQYISEKIQQCWEAWQAHASQPVGVPEGWKLVPNYPTPAMSIAGGAACGRGGDFAHHTYAMMLAAAPAAPAAPTVKAEQADCLYCQGHGEVTRTSGQTAESYSEHNEECPECQGTGLAPSLPAAGSAELIADAERCLFVLREIGIMDADDIAGDDVDLRFEDDEGRDTGCDVSIVDYAEKSADVIEKLIAALSAQQSAPAYGSYTTRPAEALAGIALRQLGDESRWLEIRDLNAHAFPGIGPHDYYPVGTVLRMPAEQQSAPERVSVPRELIVQILRDVPETNLCAKALRAMLSCAREGGV